MGRLSEALKKSMQEREKQKQLREKESMESLKRSGDREKSAVRTHPFDETKEVSTPDAVQARGKHIRKRFLLWKERFTEYAKSAVYVVKTKDDSVNCLNTDYENL